MNLIGSIILAALAADFIVGMIADRLNLKQVSTDLPRAFQGWYDPRQYARSQRYLKVKTRFGWVYGAVELAAVLLFWFGGGFAVLDRWVRGLPVPALAAGLLYIAVLAAARALLGMPFGLYHTFVIEQRFGFNRTTWKTWLKDRIKGGALALLIGVPLLAAVLAFFQYAGGNAWWACWILTAAVTLVLQYIAPAWIMPLFNRFEPLPPGPLRDAITAYARSIDFALENIFVMDGSRRSSKSNAFFTGFGRHRRIVLFDTLIERHGIEELVAVLAHEMGHYKEKHIARMMALGFAQAGLMFYILSWFISYPPLFAAFGIPHPSVYAGLVLFGMLYAPLEALLGIVMSALSRRHEYAADRFAARTAPDGAALATALKKLSVDNLSNLRPHPLYVWLHYSHPPILQRLAAIERQLTAEGTAPQRQ